MLVEDARTFQNVVTLLQRVVDVVRVLTCEAQQSANVWHA